MLSEQQAIDLIPRLGSKIGISDVEVLTPEEYESQGTPSGWYEPTPDSAILRITIYGTPEKHIIQLISTLCYQTQYQVQYNQGNENKAETIYLCPTSNNFNPMYSLLGEPQTTES